MGGGGAVEFAVLKACGWQEEGAVRMSTGRKTHTGIGEVTPGFSSDCVRLLWG